MRNRTLLTLLILVAAFCGLASKNEGTGYEYRTCYRSRLEAFIAAQTELMSSIRESDLLTVQGRHAVHECIDAARLGLKTIDFWMRYLGPLPYKHINGPLPVEWETEVFEKYEKPYKRTGAGLTLAELYLDEPGAEKDSLLLLIHASEEATAVFMADSITGQLATHDHFYLCNRLFLLNLAAIYTTGFECPDTARIIPELRAMFTGVRDIYTAFNQSFPETPLPPTYLSRYDEAIAFVNAQPDAYSRFDHFGFLRDHVGPLFSMNQQAIRMYHVQSRSYMDYALTKTSTSIFGKDLYEGQEAKGIFRRVKDPEVLAEIDHVGQLLFHDPILSGNDQRSCASCHKPGEYFTDTAAATAVSFDHQGELTRNTPTLINVVYDHLLMLDGKHITLQAQAHGVMSTPTEMGGNEADLLRKVLSCPDYRRAFERLLRATPSEKEITMEHVASAITFYYSKFSTYRCAFDRAMDEHGPIDPPVIAGFNLFMSKAQCATCHFVPQFNGVKPPFVGSEFEVIGVPEDAAYASISDDKGRYIVNPAQETLHAFRTGSLRNIAHTAPYMHNGVFTTLDQVLDHYDAGGGAGKGLEVPNQTLSSDSLHLTLEEKASLLAFLRSLDETIVFDTIPTKLPHSKIKALNARKPGGEY